MASPLGLVGIDSLVRATPGLPDVVIGVIDGPVDVSHSDLRGANLRILDTLLAVECKSTTSPACIHGTFVAGILCARRGSPAPAISPGCSFVIKPIFCEAADIGQCPVVTPQNLASAISATISAGAKVINLSLGLADTALQDNPELRDSFDNAFRKGAIVVVAAGNQGRIGQIPLFNHPWVIPVAACDQRGQLQKGSNLGPSLGRNGLMAPGVDITSTSSTGGYIKMSGTSVAAPFVTGTIALLWSLFPNAGAQQVRRAVLLPNVARRTIIPPLLNAESSANALRAMLP